LTKWEKVFCDFALFAGTGIGRRKNGHPRRQNRRATPPADQSNPDRALDGRKTGRNTGHQRGTFCAEGRPPLIQVLQQPPMLAGLGDDVAEGREPARGEHRQHPVQLHVERVLVLARADRGEAAQQPERRHVFERIGTMCATKIEVLLAAPSVLFRRSANSVSPPPMGRRSNIIEASICASGSGLRIQPSKQLFHTLTGWHQCGLVAIISPGQ